MPLGEAPMQGQKFLGKPEAFYMRRRETALRAQPREANHQQAIRAADARSCEA